MAIEANPRGIPKAPFMDNIENILGGQPAEITLNKFQEMLSKYKTMEEEADVAEQNPRDSENLGPGACLFPILALSFALRQVNFLLTKAESDESICSTFELNDTLWVSARVNTSEKVLLWLGANVMLEYEANEARELLLDKLGIAQRSLIQVQEDLQFLREQITTVEVNFSRVHNFDVKQRKKE